MNDQSENKSEPEVVEHNETQPSTYPEVETTTDRPTIETVNEDPLPPVRKSMAYKQQLDWDLENFEEQNVIKQFDKLLTKNLVLQEKVNNGKISVSGTNVKAGKLFKEYYFTLKGENNQGGNVEITRKYSDFYALRQAFVRRWPGLFVPPVPQKGNIGNTEKQIMKNKIIIVNNFLVAILESEAMYSSEEFKIFLTGNQNQVQKNLDKLKAHSLETLYGIYKSKWPKFFQQQTDADEQVNLFTRIRNFEDYFGQKKKELANQKDEIKKLAQLRTKLLAQRQIVLQNSLPEYENIILNWFDGKRENPQTKEEKKQQTKTQDQTKQTPQIGQEIKQQQIKQQEPEQQTDQRRFYSSKNYKNIIEKYRNDIFPKPESQNQDWLIYQLFKIELKQIESIIQAINTFKYLNTQRDFYARNIEGNKNRIDDLANNKLNLKTLFLGGTQEQKKNKIVQQTQVFQNNLKLIEQLWLAGIRLVSEQIQKFQVDRCQFYKRGLLRAFSKQALYMGRLLNLYLEVHRVQLKG